MIYDLQKASVLKRISAFLLDFILITVLATGMAWLMTVITGYDTYAKTIDERTAYYEQKHGLTIEGADFENMSDELRAKYEAMDEEFMKDPEVIKASSMIINLTLIILSVSIMVAFLVLELGVPLILKNGQTVGKKVFALGVMHTTGVRLTKIAHFIRVMLGKYAVETMIPVFIIMMAVFGNGSGLIALFLLLIFEMVLIISTKTNSCIHDAISHTVVVDLSTQMIFETDKELLDYKKKIHQEQTERNSYYNQ